MALYHLNTSYVSRASTNSCCAHVAYICGEKVYDIRTGMTFGDRKKGSEVVYKNILLPEGMEHLNNTEKLWNEVEKFEDLIAEERYGKYKDPIKQAKSLAAKEKFLSEAVTAFKMECALPKEMKLEEKKELSDRIAKEIFGSKNLIVQYAIHDKKDNPHVHYAANFRPVIDGSFSKRKVYFLSSDIKEIRKGVADITNNYAKERGYDFAIDHRSYAERGIAIEPTKHLGWFASKLENDSRIVLENREILSRNAALLLKSPEEMIKVLIENKTIFNLDELKRTAKEKFGNDRQSWYVLKELLEEKSADGLIDRASRFGYFLEVSHKARELAMLSDNGLAEDDINSIKDLRVERELLASQILKNIGDYEWLMSKVGMRKEVLSAMASVDIVWNDRAAFVGHDLPDSLRSGDTLSSLAKSFGSKKLDEAIVALFNLENLGQSFKGKEAYISERDLKLEEDIADARSKLINRKFGNDVSFAVRMLKGKPEQNIYGVIRSQERKQGYQFSREQKEAAVSLTQDNSFAGLVGKAGTGKTTTLRCVAASYQKAGYRVIGTSFQGAAVAELHNSLGEYMNSGFTLSKLTKEWRSIDNGRSGKTRASLYELSEKTVVILDEAAMSPRYLLKSVIERALEKDAKIIAVGDYGQISAIDRGDIGRLLLADSCELKTVMRQAGIEDKEASSQFALGAIKEGIESYSLRDKVVIKETDFSTKLFLLHNVANKIISDGAFKHLLIAYKNSDVEDFNFGIQRILKEEGRLTGNGITVLTGISSLNPKEIDEVLANEVIKSSLSNIRGNVVPIASNSITYAEACTLLQILNVGSKEHKFMIDKLKPREFYVGDKIRFTSNWNKGIDGKKVYNGSLGVITSYNASSNTLVITDESGAKTRVDLSLYQSLDLGYALTINRSQGKTGENSYLYLSNSKGAKIGSKEFYVGATRHTDNLTIYTSKEYLGDKELYQKIEEKWKMTADDLKGNSDIELVYRMEQTSNYAYKLWSTMQRDVRSGKCDLWDHEQFGEYQKLKGELSVLGVSAKNNWEKVRIYASGAGITIDDINRWISRDDTKVKSQENSLLSEYRGYRKKAQELWVNILQSRTRPTGHENYGEFKLLSSQRNECAYRLASFGSEQEIYDRTGKQAVTHIYNHVEKSEWKKILRHSGLYIKERTNTVNKDNDKNIRAGIIKRDQLKVGAASRRYEQYQSQKELWDNEQAQLKSEVRFKAEYIVRGLLGEPNKKLSNGRELRYGDSGKLTVKIRGEKAGNWYDFARGEGGDLFRLTQEIRGGSFKDAADYLRQSVGMRSSTSIGVKLGLVDETKEKYRLKALKEEKIEQERQDRVKLAYVDKLYARGKDIGDRTVAHRYLTKVRAINVELGFDIKTTGIYDREKKQYLPALLAFARDKSGTITGGQQILLDKITGSKANTDIPKKSFGKIAGSFVDVGNVISADNQLQSKKNAPNVQANKITIIAEGLETGLSVKQALREHGQKREGEISVLCSLGISNIRNYQPEKGEKIIIAADNDGANSNTSKVIENARLALEEKGAFVEVVKPAKEGDFNDVLKAYGAEAISKVFEPVLSKQTASTLVEYLGKDSLETKLDDIDKSNLAYIQKYNLSESKIIDAYRKGDIHGKLALEEGRKKLEFADQDIKFLIKHGIKDKDQLSGIIQNTQDITLTAQDLRKECQKFAEQKFLLDKMGVENNDQYGREERSFEYMTNIQKYIKDISAYLHPAEMSLVKHYDNRLKVYDIVDAHKKQYPVEAQRFKEEMQALNRFNSSDNTEKALVCYQEKGLVAATEFAENKVSNIVIYRLSQRANILLSDKSFKGKEYIEAVAKDDQIMRYIDKALSEGKRFDSPEPKDNNLLDYANQRDVNQILTEIKNVEVLDRFKTKIEDLQNLTSREDLRDAIKAYKDKGIKQFETATNQLCNKAVNIKIELDIHEISKGRVVQGFDQNNYKDKSEYLNSVISDKTITQYINPKSDIGKEMEQQKQLSERFELER